MKTIFHHAYDVKEENGRFRPMRFTDRQIEALYAIKPMFGNLGRCTAGISLKFHTDADEISFSYQYTVLYTRIGGFDVYENGVMCASLPLPKESCEGVFTYKKESAGETLIEIFLPANAETVLWDINLGAYRPAAPAEGKMLLFYGDSLTQSAYINTPSLSFAPIVSALTGSEYINRGVGSLFYDASYIDEADTVKPDVVFVALGANDLVRHDAKNDVVIENGEAVYCTDEDIPMLMDNARAYLEKIKAVYRGAKIYVISSIYGCAPTTESRVATKRRYNAALKALAEDLSLTCIDGMTLSPHIAACHVEDGLHLTALGGAMVAQSLLSYIAGSVS